MASETILIGAGGFGREALDVLRAAGIALAGVADDSPSDVNLGRLRALGVPYVGTIDEALSTARFGRYALGIGSPRARGAVASRLDHAGLEAITAIHPAATIGSLADLGSGTIVCAGVQISTNVTIGRHVHLNPNVTIGHDTVLEDFVSVNPGAIVSGEVVIGRETLVGAGSVILQGLAVGENATIGAAACVTKPVASDAVVKGIPAR